MSQAKTEASEKPPLLWRWLPNRKSRRVTLAVIAGVILIAGGYYWWSNRQLIDQSIVEQASFAVYAPKQAPSGYQFASEQTNLASGMLTYQFDESAGEDSIMVTVQARPDGFNMATLVEGGNVSSTGTKNGIVYDLSAGGTSKYLLDSGDALVFMTSSADIGMATISSIADSLVRLN